jgi:aspartate kinase
MRRATEPSRRWCVLKFGGTSVTGVDKVDTLAGIVRMRAAERPVVVVVSALAGVTSELRRLVEVALRRDPSQRLTALVERHADAVASVAPGDDVAAGRVSAMMEELERLVDGISLVHDCSPRTLDRVLSIGERASAVTISAALRARGLDAIAVDAQEWIVTDDGHGEAAVDFPATEERVRRAVGELKSIPVVTGFLGGTAAGVRTTLGTGGSDYSAAVIGWALAADEVEIWTDVDGMMTGDPRVVADARPIRSIGFGEVLELSHWGARVLHPKTVRPLRERGIPLSIRNTFAPQAPGTRVDSNVGVQANGPVRGIASVDKVALVRLSGFGYGGTPLGTRLLAALDSVQCPVLMMTQGCSDRSACVVVPETSLEDARRVIADTFALERQAGLVDEPLIDEGCAIVAVVGESMRDAPGVAGRVFAALGQAEIGVRAIAQGCSQRNISFVVQEGQAPDAIRAIHGAFFPSRVVDTERLETTVAVATRDRAVLDVVELAHDLVSIPSVTGSEHGVTDFVRRLLEATGWSVTLQEVSSGRANLFATRGAEGGVTLSTHLDTVPDFFTPRLADGRLYGRGSCDAKGIAAAMIVAADRLARAGEERVDLLFVVGEELRSDGARLARTLPARSRFLVNGEPTESRLVRATKGSQQLRITTRGREAHSAYPELGDSAVSRMVGLLAELPGLELPVDPELGPTTVNVGTIEGGSAPSVVAGACTARLMIRLVGDTAEVRERFESWIDGRADLTWGSNLPVQRFRVVDDFETAIVAYTSDVPFLHRFGEPLMFGPGSIHVAHTRDEYVGLDELRASVDAYERLVHTLLEEGR